MSNQAIKKKRKQRRWPLILVFLLGLSILIYPLVSRLYYETKASQQVSDFDTAREALQPEDVTERLRLAHAYNESLVASTLSDPYSGEQKEGIAAYARMLEIREKIGYVNIPRISVEIPMYAGTSEEVLQKGAGHLEGTSLPVGGNSTHSVITAHRGLPNARLFSELDKLMVGDKFYITNVGGTLAYQVDQIETIEPSEFEKLAVVPGHDYVTLLTCTPYMVNSHRLLVRGHQVEYVPAQDEAYISEHRAAYFYKYAFFVTLGLLLVMLYITVSDSRKRKRAKKRRMAADAAAASGEPPTPTERKGEDDENHS